jgi:hypothetical protein
MYRDKLGRLHKANGLYAKETKGKGSTMKGGFAISADQAKQALAMAQSLKPSTKAQKALRSVGANKGKVGKAFDKIFEVGRQFGFGEAMVMQGGMYNGTGRTKARGAIVYK